MTDTPPWERLRAAPGAALRVERPRRLRVDRLVIVDGVVAADSATVIWAWRGDHGYRFRAARIDATTARTFDIEAEALEVHAADDALARLLGFDPEAPPVEIEWHWLEPPATATPVADPVCVCKSTPAEEIETAIRRGWRTTDGVKRATKATFGSCQGRLCSAAIAARASVEPGSPLARITPRPPLVPVPTSILAAFAPPDEG
jgi:hypothetical protein